MSSETFNWTTRGGTAWQPEFVTDINQSTCIGCGRCFKVCPPDVFDLVEREADDDDEYEDDVMMVMALKDADDCIGCGACARVCPKECHTHTPASAL